MHHFARCQVLPSSPELSAKPPAQSQPGRRPRRVWRGTPSYQPLGTPRHAAPSALRLPGRTPPSRRRVSLPRQARMWPWAPGLTPSDLCPPAWLVPAPGVPAPPGCLGLAPSWRSCTGVAAPGGHRPTGHPRRPGPYLPSPLWPHERSLQRLPPQPQTARASAARNHRRSACWCQLCRKQNSLWFVTQIFCLFFRT